MPMATATVRQLQDRRTGFSPSNFSVEFKESLFPQDGKGGKISGLFVPLWPQDDVHTTLGHKQKELAILYMQELKNKLGRYHSSSFSKKNVAEPQVTLSFVDVRQDGPGAMVMNHSTTAFCSSMHHVPQRFSVRPIDIASSLLQSITGTTTSTGKTNHGGCNLFVSGWL